MASRGRLLSVVAILLAAGTALAAEEGKAKAPKPKEKAPPSALRGEYAILASQCQLSDEQKARLEAAVKAGDEARKTWEQANATKADDLKKQQAEAREKKDADALKRIGAEMKALTAERTAIQARQQADILAVLTSDQRITWEGFRLYRQAMGRYKRLEPAQEQTAQMRALCNQAGKDILALQGDESAIRKGQAEIQKKLAAAIESDVLTAEQREKLKVPPPKPEKPKAPPAEAKATPEM
jgi:hypothetical protein